MSFGSSPSESEQSCGDSKSVFLLVLATGLKNTRLVSDLTKHVNLLLHSREILDDDLIGGHANFWHPLRIPFVHSSGKGYGPWSRRSRMDVNVAVVAEILQPHDETACSNCTGGQYLVSKTVIYKLEDVRDCRSWDLYSYVSQELWTSCRC